MSEETAFLEALKANPADDTARLVYADWLDDHNEPAKAEYLRLVATLARAELDYAREQPDVARVLALAETLPHEWRTEAGSRFKVIFYGCLNSAKKVGIIKAVRNVTGFGLAQTASVVELVPGELLTWVPFERALIARDTIRDAGGTVYFHPYERNDRPIALFYTITAHRQPAADIVLDEKRRALFAKFLQDALNISAVQARKLAQGDRVLIAENLDVSTALAQSRQLDKFVPWHDHDSDSDGNIPALGIWTSMVLTAPPDSHSREVLSS